MKKAVCLVSLLVVCGSAGAAQHGGGLPSFKPARYPSMKSPQSVAIGDLNADGKADVVAAHGGLYELRHVRAVSVLLNRGQGRFGAARPYLTGKPGDENGAWSVAIGDLDADGDADLATANPGGRSVSVLANRGDGTFQPSVTYPINRAPWDVAIVDLNGDDEPDVVTANPNTVSILLNRGDAGLQAPVEHPTGRDTWALAVADLNQDGKPDVVTASHRPSTVSVLINRGDGSFEPRVELPTGPGPTSVEIGDLNGDAQPDVVTSNGSSSPGGPSDWVDTVSVLLNRGDGTFRPKRDYRAPVNDYRLEFSSLAIADLNGDAKPDVAMADGDHFAVSALLGRRDGTFRRRVDYEWVALGNAAPGYGARAIAIGDLNGDRRPDVVTPRFKSISVFVNTPGLCTVPSLEVANVTLARARKAIASAHCRVGRIHRVYSLLESGLVQTQEPVAGTMLGRGGKVDLWVSRGRRSS